MKRGLVILIALLLIPSVYASINVAVEPAKLNIGDTLKVSGTVNVDYNKFAVLEVALKCGEGLTPILTKSVSLTSGQDLPFSTTFKVSGSLEGSCNAEAKLKVDGQTAETGNSNAFIVTKELSGTFNKLPEFLYLGDELNIEGSVARLDGKTFDGYGNFYLLNNGVIAFLDTIEVKGGLVKYTKSTDGMPSGTYTAKVEISDQYGNKDNFEIGSVQILGALKVSAGFAKEIFNPGENVKIEGNILKPDNRDAKSGTVRATFNNELYEAKFSKGFYRVSFDIPPKIRSGDHLIEVKAIDESGNTGSATATLKVNAIPTKLGANLANSVLEPEGILSMKASVIDQAGDEAATDLILSVYDTTDKKMFSDTVHTNEEINLELTSDAVPGEWKVVLELNKIKETITFNVNEKRFLNVYLEGQKLYVTNKGNVDVKDYLEIFFNGPVNTSRAVKLNLDVEETTEIDLGAGLITGYYDVATNGEEFKEVSIVKKGNLLKIFVYIVAVALLLLLIHMGKGFVKLGKIKKYESKEREKGQLTFKKIQEIKQNQESVEKKAPFAEGAKEFRDRILADARDQDREETRKKFMEDFFKRN